MIERIRQWMDESDRAVSPVIGVILMVAITVILAAVIGSFVLGIGGDLNESPQVRLAVSDASDQLDDSTEGQDVLNIEHQGGDTVAKSDLTVKVNKTDGSSANVDTSLADEDFTVGSIVRIPEDGSNHVTSGTELRVRVTHNPTNSLLLDTTVTVN